MDGREDESLCPHSPLSSYQMALLGGGVGWQGERKGTEDIWKGFSSAAAAPDGSVPPSCHLPQPLCQHNLHLHEVDQQSQHAVQQDSCHVYDGISGLWGGWVQEGRGAVDLGDQRLPPPWLQDEGKPIRHSWGALLDL